MSPQCICRSAYLSRDVMLVKVTCGTCAMYGQLLDVRGLGGMNTVAAAAVLGGPESLTGAW